MKEFEFTEKNKKRIHNFFFCVIQCDRQEIEIVVPGVQWESISDLLRHRFWFWHLEKQSPWIPRHYLILNKIYKAIQTVIIFNQFICSFFAFFKSSCVFVVFFITPKIENIQNTLLTSLRSVSIYKYIQEKWYSHSLYPTPSPNTRATVVVLNE